MPQFAIRVTDEQLAAIHAAIKRVHHVDDPVGLVSDYLREAALVAAGVETSTRSLGAVVARYATLCRRARPALLPAEWKLICDALNGTWLADAISVIAVPIEIADALRLNDLATKWLATEDERAAVDRALLATRTHSAEPRDAALLAEVRARGTDLAARLARLSYAELLAIVDTVERYWASDRGIVPGEDGWRDERTEIT